MELVKKVALGVAFTAWSYRLANALRVCATLRLDRGRGCFDLRLASSPCPLLHLAHRATCLLANVSVRSGLAPCVLHRSGHLRLERCSLTCTAHGLEHLASPIITVARSPPATAATVAATAATAAATGGAAGALLASIAQAAQVCGGGLAALAQACRGPAAVPISVGTTGDGRPAAATGAQGADGTPGASACSSSHGCNSSSSSSKEAFRLAARVSAAAARAPAFAPQALLSGAGLGRLVVAETQLSGGGQGVHCWGSGGLRGVRAIYGAASSPFFFFEVDSR